MNRVIFPREAAPQILKGLIRVDRLASRGKYLEAHSILTILRLSGINEFVVTRVVTRENLKALADWRGYHVTH